LLASPPLYFFIIFPPVLEIYPKTHSRFGRSSLFPRFISSFYPLSLLMVTSYSPFHPPGEGTPQSLSPTFPPPSFLVVPVESSMPHFYEGFTPSPLFTLFHPLAPFFLHPHPPMDTNILSPLRESSTGRLSPGSPPTHFFSHGFAFVFPISLADFFGPSFHRTIGFFQESC